MGNKSLVCLLCKEREANNLNSHIVPYFLLKTMLNSEGKKGRGFEFNFQIKKIENEVYFGRNISPERLKEVLGKEFSEEDFNGNIDPHARDNIFCSICEQKFGKLESFYSSCSEKQQALVVEKNISSQVSTLFWLSIIWRCSVTRYHKFVLPNKLEEKLRRILNSTLGNSEQEYKSATFIEELCSFSYALIKLNFFDKNQGVVLLARYNSMMPIIMCINEYILVFFHNKAKDGFQFFGVEEIYKNKTCVNTSNCKSEQQILLEEKGQKILTQKIFDSVTKTRINTLKKFISGFLRRLNIAEGKINQEILNRIIEKGHYTFDEITESLLEVLSANKYIN